MKPGDRPARGPLALLAAVVAVAYGLVALLATVTFRCGTSDAIPNCSSDAEVAGWWGLPSAGLVLACASVWAALRYDRAGGAHGRTFLALWALAVSGYAGWTVGLFLPG